MITLTDEQKQSLAKLSEIIQECSDNGLFDVIDSHPDIINNFCDDITYNAKQQQII